MLHQVAMGIYRIHEQELQCSRRCDLKHHWKLNGQTEKYNRHLWQHQVF